MRPTRLELEGFTSFREPTEITFSGADFFALVGPTGAGKSSIIDAMTFALYGCVPRYGDKRLVAPTISQGMLEAKLRFDFTVGSQAFSVVRVVRRSGKGATTKEARLESHGEVLAGDSDSVTSAVVRLLGLGFDHFTKCVVLPQGNFARFLHDQRGDRNELLKQLLDFGIFDRMMELARGRYQHNEARAAFLTEQLGADVETRSDEALVNARHRVAALDALLETIDKQQPDLERLSGEAKEAETARDSAREQVSALRAIAAPRDVASLAARTAQLVAAAEAAETTRVAASEILRNTSATVAALPDREPLVAAQSAHRSRATLNERRAVLVTKQAHATREAEAAQTARAAAGAAVLATRTALDHARLEHRAADLAQTLVAGEPCPVCHQTVHAPPIATLPADLDEAERAAHQAEEVAADAVTKAQATSLALVQLDEQLRGVDAQLSELAEAISAHPDPVAVEEQLAACTTAIKAERDAREDEASAREKHARAASDVEANRARERSAWEVLERARDSVAAFAPPPIDRSDLAAAWEGLVRWAAETAAGLEGVAADHDRVASERRSARQTIVDELFVACDVAGITIPKGKNARDVVVHTRAQAAATVDTITAAREQAAAKEQELAAVRGRGALARELHKQLGARYFEEWLMDEAITSLVARATELLLELSTKQYSLTVDEQGNFAVIDHRNADEARLAKTLSGGETFLASLALALALADQLGSMASGGAARLESIVLDEGFGTLDPETLDTVAAAIENLAARGRVVGIITHVRELADRIPVRFEVSKGPAGSSVQRVDA